MKLCLGLMQRKECLCLTWRGRLAVLALVALAWVGLLYGTYPYLATHESRPGGFLIVEGWAPDYVFEAVTNEFAHHRYEKILVTGGPLDKGSPLLGYKTTAEVGAATLAKMGLATNLFEAVPAPYVPKDRTYQSALILKAKLAAAGKLPTNLNIITLGAHARRSRMLFERVFGKDATIGVLAFPSRDFDEQHWWRSSGGVRTVMSELFSYGYARFIFTKPE